MGGMGRKIDTQAIGLDVGLSFIKWLTGAENLHYGLWDGLEVSAGNLRRAQDAYTEKLFRLLPDGPLRILDIGGGAGETARKLLALGHSVDIVVPSAFLAERCRKQAPDAQVHEMRFEDFKSDTRFDLCLFSESFQYIPPDFSLPRCLELLEPGGHIIIADCFRTPEFTRGPIRAAGGGHRIARVRDIIADLPLEMTSEEDITASVAPSIDLEQELFNVFGFAVTRIDGELAVKRSKTRWVLHRMFNSMVGQRRRERLASRLMEKSRTGAQFQHDNIYLMMKLRASG